MRAQTISWLPLRSRKTDLLVVVGEPRDYHAGETGSREGSWKRRRLNTFQLFDHTGCVTAFAAAGFPATYPDNPEMLSKVCEARLRLQQLKSNLDFFGLAVAYLPPFSWEYLQNTAKYFAQQAAQLERSSGISLQHSRVVRRKIARKLGSTESLGSAGRDRMLVAARANRNRRMIS